ncbi:alpha/beta hydrolase [Treponema bryantii]|uniref:alpha/beta hydrolase n=1 Tax=Treponema bryantii TaxID=163 RepID=UPI0003B6E969|nr:alpha/beta hydrolase [Treponema bryantii]
MKHSALAAFFAVLFFTITLSACKSYPAAFEVAKFINQNENGVTYIEGDSFFVVMPEEITDTPGIIFYPGGLVEYQAYLPLMEKLARKGAFCILVKMPFDFAFFDFGAAGRYMKLYPQIDRWYMAGHSLGGAMAASYISRHEEDFEGLILLAAYSTHDISEEKLKVLSIYGSNDGVLNKSHYQKYRRNLPAVGKGLTEIIIEGGNHAQFASYGAQKGDYMSEITPDEQQEKTAEEIAEWIGLK